MRRETTMKWKTWKKRRNKIIRSRTKFVLTTEFVSAVFSLAKQGILKGEVSLYSGPPVWLVWNQLYDNRWFLFLFAKETNTNQSNRSSMVQYFPLKYSLDEVSSAKMPAKVAAGNPHRRGWLSTVDLLY